MLPLLISVLAIPISFPIAILPGPSGMVVIAALVLAMFSPVHAVAFVFAEAGVKARAENIAAMIKTFNGTSLRMKPAQCWLSEYALGAESVSGRKIFLFAAMQREG
jgi:hypothetical protein